MRRVCGGCEGVCGGCVDVRVCVEGGEEYGTGARRV